MGASEAPLYGPRNGMGFLRARQPCKVLQEEGGVRARHPCGGAVSHERGTPVGSYGEGGVSLRASTCLFVFFITKQLPTVTLLVGIQTHRLYKFIPWIR